MVKYSLMHIGINCQNEAEARKAATMFEAMFGFNVKDGNSSIFAGTYIECMKGPYLGTNGHIAIGTPDVEKAQTDLEECGFRFNLNSAKYKADGTLNAIYLADEICGFAIHLVRA